MPHYQRTKGPVNANLISWPIQNMSRQVRKSDFCIYENKDVDQIRGNREAVRRLYFGYLDSTTPLQSKSKISSL